MPLVVGEPQQHKQPSRKGKRAWRKNVDITPVQKGLESLREEIIHGGPIAEKSSDKLFVVDVAGSEDIKKEHKILKPLKVDQILAERSAVPAVDSRKRPLSKIGDGITEPSLKRQKKDWVTRKELQHLRENINKRSHLTTEDVEDDTGAGFDLWDQPPLTASTVQDEYVPKPKPKVVPKTIRRAPIPMTASGQPVRPIQNPDAGTSYNPSFEAWDDLLNREGAKEVEAEETRQRNAQEQAEREARIAAIAAGDEREGQSDYESAWEGFETEDDAHKLKKKRPERKTPAQRNKIKRRRKEEQLARHQKAAEKRIKRDEEMVLALTKVNEDQDIATIEDVDGETVDDTKIRRRKLGNAFIPPKPLELVLPDELQESLRRLKPEGNLMSDRFRNLLVNGKIESRKPISERKKRRVKMTEKWSHKDFGIEV